MKKSLQEILKGVPGTMKVAMKELLDYVSELEARISVLEKPLPTSEKEK